MLNYDFKLVVTATVRVFVYIAYMFTVRTVRLGVLKLFKCLDVIVLSIIFLLRNNCSIHSDFIIHSCV